MAVKTNLPERVVSQNLCCVFAAQKANGRLIIAEMNVPKKAIPKVCSSVEVRSSPSPVQT